VRIFFWLKYRLHHFLPNTLWMFFSSKISKFRDRKYHETYKSYGTLNPELTFYVIRRRPPGWGFFSNVLFVCQGIIYAKNYGYIPVVDMQNYWIKELSSIRSINGTKNAWCYLFNQVSNFSLDEVYKSKHVILSDGSAPLGRKHYLNTRTQDLVNNPKYFDEFKNIVSLHIKLNEQTKEYIDTKRAYLNFDPANTLGIFIRGNVYFNSISKTNFSVPNLKDFLSEIEKTLNLNSIKYLFIVTDDLRIYNAICHEFKKYNVINLRYTNNLSETKWLAGQKTSYDGGVIMGYNNTLTYLSEAIFLSECAYFVGTYSNFSAFVLSLTDFSKGEKKIVLKDKVIFIQN